MIMPRCSGSSFPPEPVSVVDLSTDETSTRLVSLSLMSMMIIYVVNDDHEDDEDNVVFKWLFHRWTTGTWASTVSGQTNLFLLVDPYFTSCRFHWWARHSTTSSMLFVIGVIIFSATIFIFITVVMKWAPRSASSSLFSSRLAVSCLRPAKNPRSQKSSFNPKYSRIAFAFHQINLVCPPFTAARGPGHIPQNLTAHRDFDQIRWLR